MRQTGLSRSCCIAISKGWSRKRKRNLSCWSSAMSQELSNEGLPCQAARNMELSGVVLELRSTKSFIFYDFMEFFYYRPSLGQRIIIRVNNIDAAWNKKNSSTSTPCWYPSTWNLYNRLNQQQYLLRITQDCVYEITESVCWFGCLPSALSFFPCDHDNIAMYCSTGVWGIYGKALNE